MTKTARTALPRAASRVGVVHVGKARIARKKHSLVVRNSAEERVLPLTHLSAIFAGPGTTVTHDAAAFLGDAGVPLIWVGDGAVRCYGSVSPLATKSAMLLHQVATWADEERRVQAARRLYGMRFPDHDVSSLSIPQLRSQEGTRVREAYRARAQAHGLVWSTRTPRWRSGDDLNAALTEATQCLYGAATAVVLGLGCSPTLGIIHTGHALSFTFDLSDIFKIEVALEVACRLTAAGRNTSTLIRREMNEVMRRERVVPRMVESVYQTLGLGTPEVSVWEQEDLRLWSDEGVVPSGPNYGEVW